jgi:hypothetical protein
MIHLCLLPYIPRRPLPGILFVYWYLVERAFETRRRATWSRDMEAGNMEAGNMVSSHGARDQQGIVR